MTRLLGSSVVVLAMGCAAEQPEINVAEQATTVCGSGSTVKGVDVSYYQGTIDWSAVRADGVEFAFVRVSDGIGFEDPKFDANWQGTRDAGILRGAYQFFRPNQDAIAQADLLLSRMGALETDDLPPVIDVEANGGLGPAEVAAQVELWIDHVTAAIGRSPIIYTGYYFWRDQVGAPDFTSSPLWHAQYTSAECPNIAPPWSDWAFWQFTSSGSVAGVAGDVDTNRFNGTIDQLRELTMQPEACGTIPAEGGTIDDSDTCFRGGGPSSGLRHPTDAGENGGLTWTHTTDYDAEENFAQWNLTLAAAGKYRIEVSTPAAYAQSKQASYLVHTATGDTVVAIDQTAVDGWQTLGEFELAEGGGQFVHVGDNTGEPLDAEVQIVFDAVRLTPVDPTDPTDPNDPNDPNDPEAPGEGGCNTSGGVGLGALLALLGVRRRRS